MKQLTPEELDVDVRFLLANERTLLAWVRTSLAVIAGGIALITVHKGRDFIGVGILLLGAAMALIGYHRYKIADAAIRSKKLPPAGTGPTIEVMLVVLVAIALAVAQLTVVH